MQDTHQDPVRRRGHKRADGEGSISPYHKGGWRGRLMVGYKSDGKPDVREAYGKTQAECRRKLQEIRQQHTQEALPKREARLCTLAAYIDRWLEAVKVSIRPTTFQRYVSLLRGHVLPTLGGMTLTKLHPDDVQRLYSTLLEKQTTRGQGRSAGKPARLSARTVHHVHVVLHTALEQAVQWQELPRNVCDVVKPPKVQRTELHPPAPAELARLIDAESDQRWRTLWTVASYTGMRLGELLGLQWPDLDPQRGTLTIRRSLLQATRAGVPSYGEPKTARSRRTIALNEEALATLKAHRQAQIEARKLLGPDYAPHDLVFATATGTPLSHRNVQRAFKSALRHAELPATVRLHDLRHAHATALLAAQVPIKVASARLGHSSIGITGDLYTHVLEGMDADAARRMEALLRAPIPAEGSGDTAAEG